MKFKKQDLNSLEKTFNKYFNLLEQNENFKFSSNLYINLINFAIKEYNVDEIQYTHLKFKDIRNKTLYTLLSDTHEYYAMMFNGNNKGSEDILIKQLVKQYNKIRKFFGLDKMKKMKF